MPRILPVLMMALALGGAAFSSDVPAVGSDAPDFTLPDDAMQTFHLKTELEKGPVVLTSYLFDFTGG